MIKGFRLLGVITGIAVMFIGCKSLSKTDRDNGLDFGVIYMSPNGNDSQCGNELSRPVKTVQRAIELANRFQFENPKQDVVIYMDGGMYSFTIAEVLRPENSGVDGTLIIFRPLDKDNKPVFTAQVPLGGLKFTPHESLNNIYTTKVPEGLNFEELYINDKMMHLARFPNYNPDIRIFNGTDGKCIAPERVAQWKNPAGGYLHALHGSRWASSHYIFKGKDDKGELIMEGGWQNNRQTGPHKTYRFVENIYEELDEEGEWFLDRENHLLHIFPYEGMNLQEAAIDIAPTERESLLRFEGSESNPVKNIVFEGIIFTGTARTFMKTKEPLLRSDWSIYRSGAVYFKGSENCMIRNCDFYNIGGNAVFVDAYNKDIDICGNHMHDIGASAVCVVGETSCVRNAKYKPYGKGVEASEMDWTRGPKENKYPRSIRVHDNLIHDIGRVEKQVAGVQISVAYEVSVTHNSIYDVPRAGINVGEGAFGGHKIAYNDVFNTVLETSDHGAFNAWGRDRYWWSQGVDLVEKHETVLLDCLAPTDINNNRWKCDHGWDIDLDDGASHYNIYNNLCLNGGIKLREGFHRIARNNICLVNGMDYHDWYENSYDVVTHNILMSKHYVRPNAVKYWGTVIDYNFFGSGVEDDPRFSHIDQNSLKGDPQFVAPEKLDFRVEPTSLAYAVGFRNFDMDNFGVVSPRLKQMAKQPSFDHNNMVGRKEGKIVRLFGMEMKDIDNISDMSATGMGEKKGALVLQKLRTVPKPWRVINEMDVILSVDGVTIKNVAHLKEIFSEKQEQTNIKVEVFRNQKTQVVELK